MVGETEGRLLSAASTGGFSELIGLGGKGGGPDLVPVPGGRDIEGEQNILGTGEEFLRFLTGGERGQTALDRAVGGFDLPLQQLQEALQGKATGVLKPLISRGIEDALQTGSTAVGDIEKFLARQGGGRGQFGGSRLIQQAISGAAQQRARVPLNVFTGAIQSFLPLLAQRVQAEIGRAGVAGGALAGSQAFSRVSAGRAAQQQNLARAGIPPESKDLSGIGTAIGLGVGAAGGNPAAGAAVGGSFGSLLGAGAT